ncbi:MAG: tripartite tricarboxylate transporter substrate binding protein, partial [Burkholderiaceae bacterium]
MRRHSFLRGGLALTMAACLAGSALAQGKPATLRFLVPYPAGGAADQITRLVANDASIILGTPIVIENKGGAAGMIAAELALRAEPDGATFYVGANAPMVINQAIYEKMPYDPAKDFVPVAGMGKAPLLLVTRKDLGTPTLPALIALAKKEPGRITM